MYSRGKSTRLLVVGGILMVIGSKRWHPDKHCGLPESNPYLFLLEEKLIVKKVHGVTERGFVIIHTLGREMKME